MSFPAADPRFGDADPAVVRALHRFVRAAGSAVLLAGLAVLSGYAFRVPTLTVLYPGLRAMSVVTACCLSLLGCAVVAENFGRSRAAKRLASLAAVGAAGIAASYLVAGADVVSRPWLSGCSATPPPLPGAPRSRPASRCSCCPSRPCSCGACPREG